MPVAVAVAIRYIIMAAVQLAIWSLLEKFGIPLLNKAVVSIMTTFGVSEETAKDIMANKVIVAFEEVGIFAATLRTKMPIKVAEYLGFTTKGYALRKVGGTVAAKAEKLAVSATAKSATTAAEAAVVGEAVAVTRGISLAKVNTVISLVLKVVAMPVGIFYAFAQYVDYAAWQNPYQKTMEGLLGHLGIHPDTVMPKANTVSADVWKRIYSTVEQLKPLGISFPYSNRDTPYSRENLAKLIDEVAANITKAGGSATYKNVMGVVIPLLQFNGQEPQVPIFPNEPTGNYTALTPGQFGGTSTPTNKVFTGVVSQGVISKNLTFTPRPDDLIESIGELREAAANNLAPFLATLLGKIVYEVKVVASIITKDGFKQTGTTQRIQSGTFTNGTPKYKTVTNKFATLTLYALTDKGSRAKLTTIVLGPVNSAKLTVGQNDLRELEMQLPKDVTTNDIKEIQGVQSDNGVITTVEHEPEPERKKFDNFWRNIKGSNEELFKIEGSNTVYGADEQAITVRDVPAGYKAATMPVLTRAEVEQLIKDIMTAGAGRYSYKTFRNETGVGASSYAALTPEPVATVPANTGSVVSNKGTYQLEKSDVAGGKEVIFYPPGVTPNKSLALPITTLFDWYLLQRQQLPSVAERAKLYESMGLGQASYYTGTTEQNTKLLNALKSA